MLHRVTLTNFKSSDRTSILASRWPFQVLISTSVKLRDVLPRTSRSMEAGWVDERTRIPDISPAPRLEPVTLSGVPLRYARHPTTNTVKNSEQREMLNRSTLFGAPVQQKRVGCPRNEAPISTLPPLVTHCSLSPSLVSRHFARTFSF